LGIWEKEGKKEESEDAWGLELERREMQAELMRLES
jgi:hypothetical protein